MRAAILADQLRRLVDRDAWHGPNLPQLLEGVSAEEASRKIGPHSIAELVGHIDFWNRELLAVIAGEAYRNVPDGPEQWPMAEWEAMRREALENGARLAAAVGGIADEALERRIEGRDYTLEVLLHGIAQHTAYHLGQIAWAKKMAV